MNNQSKLHLWGNSLGLIATCFILMIAFADQLIHHDLPCPLCLLQRISFVGIGICLFMNLRLGFRPSHYGLMLLQALLGLAISVRQIFIHIKPNDPGYGHTLFGLDLYTWSALVFIIIIAFIAIALIFDHGFNDQYNTKNKGLVTVMCIFLILILANGISTFIECGPYVCPDNPTFYYLFS